MSPCLTSTCHPFIEESADVAASGFLHLFIYFFAVLEFELRASHLLGLQPIFL
jgi:hypothetical protein